MPSRNVPMSSITYLTEMGEKALLWIQERPWKKIAMFLIHPGNYVLLTLVAVTFALLISSGAIAGSFVAAVATATLTGLMAPVALVLFVVFQLREDKAKQQAKLIPKDALTQSPSKSHQAGYEKITQKNYGWFDYFFGHLVQSKRGESKYVSNSITGENKFYKKTGGLLNRSLNLAKLRPWRTLIAMIGILVFLAALILTLGYFLAPLSAFAFMSHVFLPLTTVLSAGFAGMASSGWVIIGGVSAGLVSAISVLLFTLAPLSVVDTVNRGLTLVSDESSLANGDESSSDEDNTNFSICSLVKSLFVAQSLDNEKALKQREEIFINDPKSIGISYEM